MPSGMTTSLVDDTIVVQVPPIGTDLEARPGPLGFAAPGNQPLEDPFEILNRLDNESFKLMTAMVGHARDLKNNKEEVTELEGQIKGLQDTVAAQKTTILEQAQVIKDQENTKSLLEQSEQRIAELEKQVEGLTKQPMALVSKLVVNSQEFDRLPYGENESLYASRLPAYVTIDDKVYVEKAVLCEYKKLNMGQNTGEMVNIGGIPFQRVLGADPKGEESFIQEIGPQSFFEFEGKDYIRWLIRKEHRPLLF